MPFDEAYKNKIGERLTRRLAEAIKNQEIDQEKAVFLASYILSNLDGAQDNSQLADFVSGLSSEWPMFSRISTNSTEQDHDQGNQIAGEKTEKTEDAIGEISGLIKQNKIDEAISVAKLANDQTEKGGTV
ncbi:hypothetical protein M1615_04660 [Patescibacteria group bacterium]|nr:hypothetical protein [Patescibacteria group bacterium]MCL5010196.1 hypothetical protein [Patescibacteria group bacterium]